jgi:hypothetical protein
MEGKTVLTVVELLQVQARCTPALSKADDMNGYLLVIATALMELCVQVANLNQTIKRSGEDISGIRPPA